jgi:hypothetical protein
MATPTCSLCMASERPTGRYRSRHPVDPGSSRDPGRCQAVVLVDQVVILRPRSSEALGDP